LILQTFATPKFGNWRVVDPEYRRQYTELIAQTRRATKPVYSEDMVLLMLAGKEVPWEPATITDLSRTGVFDERKVISMIEAHAFAFAIVTTGESDRYSPAVIAAFTRAYPVELRLAGMRVLSPKEGN
jgi:hypothetical protein